MANEDSMTFLYPDHTPQTSTMFEMTLDRTLPRLPPRANPPSCDAVVEYAGQYWQNAALRILGFLYTEISFQIYPSERYIHPSKLLIIVKISVLVKA